MNNKFTIQISGSEYDELRSLFNELWIKHNGDRDAIIEDAASHSLIQTIVEQMDIAVAKAKECALLDFLDQQYEKD